MEGEIEYMIEITNKMRVEVTRYSKREGRYVPCGSFISAVYALSSNEKKFLVYDMESGFVWVDFTERITFTDNADPEPIVRLLAT